MGKDTSVWEADKEITEETRSEETRRDCGGSLGRGLLSDRCGQQGNVLVRGKGS